MIIATIAFLTIVFMGGGGYQGFLPSDFNDQVKKQLADSERQEQVLDITKQMEKKVEEYKKKTEEKSKAVLELHKNYDATEAEFTDILSQVLADRRELQAEMIKEFFQMKELITANEWEAVFSEEEEQKE